MNIELLLGSLAVSENPGLESTDPRFDEIATLVQSGQNVEAAKLCEPLFGDGIYDIRLICYFLYGYWLEEGFASLLEVIDCLNNVILENWEAIGPANKRAKNVQKSLDWMLKQFLKKFHYEEDKDSPLWQQWQNSASSDDVDNILESGNTFRAGISQQLEDDAGVILDQWSKMVEWLRALQRLVYRPPEPEQVEVDESMDDSEESAVNNATVFSSSGVGLEGSYHLDLLQKKLAAFDHLIKEEKFPQAALVADDINETLANFDAKLYFPKIFEPFFRLQALNFEELSNYAEQREYPQWQAMQDWFKVDIDSFINS